MTENKTQPTDASVSEFLMGLEHDARRKDAHALVEMMQRVTGVAPQMWGPSIIGFGVRHYRYESGRTGEILRIGFSPRKSKFALYMLTGAGSDELMARLGKHTTGASCLYINKLADVDMAVLEAMAVDAWQRSDEQ